MSGILDDVGVIGENPSELFGVKADQFFVDSSAMSQTVNEFNNTEINAPLMSWAETGLPANDFARMPVAGKVIGLIWYVYSNSANPQTHTIRIYKNGVLAQDDALIVQPLETGWIKSETLNIEFSAGDYIYLTRQKSGSTNGGIVGALCTLVSYD